MEKIRLTTEEMKRLKEIELDLLLELDRICKKHNIRYIIGYGTLIGAIRHKGFIPWDDDVDVCMTRADYIRFRNACKTDLDSRFFYQTHETDENYFYLFDKLRANGTVFREQALKDHRIHHGVYLDIFPVDNLPDNRFLRKIHYAKYRLCRIALHSKYIDLSTRHGKKKLISIVLRILLVPVSKEFLYNSAEKLAVKYNHEPQRDVCCYTSTYKQKDIFPASYFSDVMDGTFEGHSVLLPSHYDEILRQIYGDYMQLPPEEKRVGCHDLQEIKL